MKNFIKQGGWQLFNLVFFLINIVLAVLALDDDSGRAAYHAVFAAIFAIFMAERNIMEELKIQRRLMFALEGFDYDEALDEAKKFAKSEKKS